MNTIALAGATGYLGRHIAAELKHRGLPAKLLVRNPAKLPPSLGTQLTVEQVEVTQPDTLHGVFDGVDTVISTVGITRQRDGLTYWDVDYQANVNLLQEAQRAGVRKFVYVSVLHGEQMRGLKIGAAKEAFVDELKASGIDYAIIRPNGFFSDLTAFLDMAKRGRVYVFGKGHVRSNPIHGADLAKVSVDAVHANAEEIAVGGPEVMTQEEIARLAFEAVGKPVRITHIPDWMRRAGLFMVRRFAGAAASGPLEFFLTVMATDMIAPPTGVHTLGAFYRTLATNTQPSPTLYSV